jgi:hypothetical protein
MRRRRTRLVRKGNYAWLNGYNVAAVLPRRVGIAQENTVFTLLLPTDWTGGGPQIGIKVERLVYFMRCIGQNDTGPLTEARVPYALFMTDATTPNDDPQLTLPVIDGGGWPVWALGNDRLLRLGTTQLGAAPSAGIGSQWPGQDGLPENMVDWKVNRRFGPDDSLRICLAASQLIYAQNETSYWLVETFSRMLLRMGAK